MRVVEVCLLAVLDAVETLLLDGGDELAVDKQCCGRLVIHRVDSKDIHHPATLLSLFIFSSSPALAERFMTVNQIERILTNFDRQYFAAIFTENSRVPCILGDR
jgi:hypothetical protein